MGEAYAVAGRRGEAVAILKNLEERASREYASPSLFASIHAVLGQTGQALDWFERAAHERDVYLNLFASRPGFKLLRSEVRFDALWKRIEPRS